MCLPHSLRDAPPDLSLPAARPEPDVPASGIRLSVWFHREEEAILEVEASRVQRMAEHLGVDAAALTQVMVRLVALHDIGKFSLAFQTKRRDLWPVCLGPIEPRPPDVP